MNCRGIVGLQYNYKGLDVMLQMSGNKQFQREGEKRVDVRNSYVSTGLLITWMPEIKDKGIMT